MTEVSSTTKKANGKRPWFILLSFDLETTGLKIMSTGNDADQITEIGCASAVLYHVEEEDDKKDTVPSFDYLAPFQTYVKVNKEICAKSQSITHITEKTLENAPSFAQAMTMWSDYITAVCAPFDPSVPRVLIAHNGNKFDVPMITIQLERNGMSAVKYMRQLRLSYLLDTILLSRAVVDTTILPRDKDGKACFKLGGIYQALCKKPLIGAHGALADCSAVLELLLNHACFRDAFLKDIALVNSKYICNPMTLVSEIVQSSAPKISSPSQQPANKKCKTKTLDQFFSVAKT